METVANVRELQSTVYTLEKYLTDKKEPEYGFALDLVKRGTCFLAVESAQGYKFYPSRFIGYAGNTMKDHLNNVYKDGRETNPAISAIVGLKPEPNVELNEEYVTYCEYLGFTARDKGSFGVERKFWRASFRIG
jgi:hypothetical protein